MYVFTLALSFVQLGLHQISFLELSVDVLRDPRLIPLF